VHFTPQGPGHFSRTPANAGLSGMSGITQNFNAMDASRKDYRKPKVQLKNRSNSIIGRINSFDDSGFDTQFGTPNRNGFGEKHRSLAPETDTTQYLKRMSEEKGHQLSTLK
jgi:hypothetical protein